MWTYLTPHTSNAETLDLLGDDTKILRDIIDSSNKDKEMLPAALRNKVKNMKEQNYKE